MTKPISPQEPIWKEKYAKGDLTVVPEFFAYYDKHFFDVFKREFRNYKDHEEIAEEGIKKAMNDLCEHKWVKRLTKILETENKEYQDKDITDLLVVIETLLKKYDKNTTKNALQLLKTIAKKYNTDKLHEATNIIANEYTKYQNGGKPIKNTIKTYLNTVIRNNCIAFIDGKKERKESTIDTPETIAEPKSHEADVYEEADRLFIYNQAKLCEIGNFERKIIPVCIKHFEILEMGGGVEETIQLFQGVYLESTVRTYCTHCKNCLKSILKKYGITSTI